MGGVCSERQRWAGSCRGERVRQRAVHTNVPELCDRGVFPLPEVKNIVAGNEEFFVSLLPRTGRRSQKILAIRTETF